MLMYSTRLVRWSPNNAYGTLFPVFAITESLTLAAVHSQPVIIPARTNVGDSESSVRLVAVGMGQPIVSPIAPAQTAAATHQGEIRRRAATNAMHSVAAEAAANTPIESGATMPSKASQSPMNQGSVAGICC